MKLFPFGLLTWYLVADSMPTYAQTNDVQLSPQQAEQQRRVDQMVNTPFDFYGKVIDQDGHPVANAIADISVMGEVGKTEGQTKRQATTDAGGLFSVKEIRAFGIIVTVSKTGYVGAGGPDGPGGSSSRKHLTADKPAIYHLQKK
jgi:protocatechuate 3,4-dioxygenase beta subunit